MASKNIVIVGGGFAGTTLARALDGKLPENYQLVLVSEDSYSTFNPLLPEAVGASIFPEHVVAPIRQMLAPRHGARFVMGRVTDIDFATRILRCASLAGQTVIDYAHLVFAFGNRARLDLLPGLEAHGLPLKTVGDAMHIRNMVLRRLAGIELETDPARRRMLGHFVVIGGGFSGVEVAGELIDCLVSIRHYYPRVNADELRITLVHDLDRLLPELPLALGQAAQRSLAARGVQMRLVARAQEVRADGVRLMDDSFLDSATVICTIGTRPNALIEQLLLPQERGRIAVEPSLQVRDQPGLWAIGDCALVPNAYDGAYAPPTAQFAVREAHHLASNLLAVLGDRPVQAFKYRSRGILAGIGHKKGVAQIWGFNLTGLPAWLLWRAFYLSQMPTFGRKLRLFVEWTWGMFFPPDITHLRFTRSSEVSERTDDPASGA